MKHIVELVNQPLTESRSMVDRRGEEVNLCYRGSMDGSVDID
jgi:hypothetical protein